MLRSVIADIDTQLSNVKTIADAWATRRHGDAREAPAGDRCESPELYDRLLDERNRNWVAPVEACLKPKRTSCFVVVGAAHLVGPDSLVTLLQTERTQGRTAVASVRERWPPVPPREQVMKAGAGDRGQRPGFSVFP